MSSISEANSGFESKVTPGQLTCQSFVLRFQLIDLPLQLLLLSRAKLHPLLHVVHVLLLAAPGVLSRYLIKVKSI